MAADGSNRPPKRDLPPGLQEQLDLGYGGAGLQTFGQRPFLTEPEQLDEWQPDVAIVGAPFDISTTHRPGARFGPRALRTQSYESGTYHLDLGIEIFDHLEVVDFGDAYCPHGQIEPSFANIQERVAMIVDRGIIPVILGGDHSITLPSATAVANHYGFGKVGIVHFDAHADTADIIEGNLMSHGTPMRRLIESGAILGRNFVQVGLRGYWPPAEVFEWMQAQGMRWHLMNEIWERGIQAVIEDAVAEALDGADFLYVSVDIDVLDPGFAPGTGTPEPGGMNTADLLRTVRRLALDANVVALDVVEISPPYDVSDNTVNAGHRVVFEALAGMAARKRRAAGGEATVPGRV